MCGIVGFSQVESDSRAEEKLRRAVSFLAHRGPDASGEWLDPAVCIALGHTRLKVLDLSNAANQPFLDQDASLSLVFNGEIYNWLALREQLEQRGYDFSTQSDTEVILALYNEYDTGMLQHLEGMYSFALWDGRKEVLFCARDPVGKKPFVYSEQSTGFYFSSEIPALLELLPYAPAPNLDGIANFMLHNLRHIPDPQTAWDGVVTLRPGHALLVRRGVVQKHWRHWYPRFDFEVSKTSIRNGFLDSVCSRMLADVPVGVLLSGGVDSSAIAAVMQQESDVSVQSYVLGRDAQDEDVRRARLVAVELELEHTELFFDEADLWDRYSRLQQTFGAPLALLPLVYTQQLCERMKADGVTVALSGHGADELFNGYNGQWQRAMASMMLKGLGHTARFLPLSGSARSVLNAKGHRRSGLYSYIAKQQWPQLFNAETVSRLSCYVADELDQIGSVGPSSYYIDESNFAAILLENQHSLTLAADFPAMQAGVEVRCPFLDVKLIELVFSMPLAKRVPVLPVEDKVFLKNLIRDLVPRSILGLPKRGFGFGIQEADLFRNEWKSRCEKVLFQSDTPIFKAETIQQSWQQLQAGDDSQAATLAKIMTVLLWFNNH